MSFTFAKSSIFLCATAAALLANRLRISAELNRPVGRNDLHNHRQK